MSAGQRIKHFRRGAALLPLALLSAAFTVALTGGGTTSLVTQQTMPDPTVAPDIPAQAIEAPASVSAPITASPGVLDRKIATIVPATSVSGVPSVALAAYQRAETVINAADPSCHLNWQLVAALGRVESNHGQANGNSLDTNGVARPGIYGIALDGSNNTRVIRDTDAGQYDNDEAYDRAVGPMQFIPSTWSMVGVDANGDGKRDPQSVHDAALAAAVYLCSGDDDLSTDAGLRAAIFRYNHSQAYVDLVLEIMKGYTSGDYQALPTGTTGAPLDIRENPTPTGTGTGTGTGPGTGPGAGPGTGPNSNNPGAPGNNGNASIDGAGSLPPLPGMSGGTAPGAQLLTPAQAQAQCGRLYAGNAELIQQCVENNSR